MKTLDLFSGIGGFSLGLERVGFKTVAFCETDKYCKLILKKHWEDVKIYHDVREINRQQYEQDGCELPEVITGGFPCQPFSVAGRKKGTGDNRYLWPEMFRVIKEFKARWIIAENVRGIINIEDGVVFERVHSDLESQGYETQTFIIPAAGVGASHRRERVWIVAHSKHNGLPSSKKRESTKETISKESKGQNNSFHITGTSSLSSPEQVMENSRRTIRGEQFSRNKESIGSGTSQETERSADSDSVARSSEREKIMADSSSIQSDGRGRSNDSIKEQGQKQAGGTSGSVANTESIQSRKPSESKRGEDTSRGSEKKSTRNWWDIEPNVGRVADGVQGRIHRLKGLGNAIVPQIAEEIGKAIMKVECEN